MKKGIFGKSGATLTLRKSRKAGLVRHAFLIRDMAMVKLLT